MDTSMMPIAIPETALASLEKSLGRSLRAEYGARKTYEDFTAKDIDELRSLGRLNLDQTLLVLHWVGGKYGLRNAHMFVAEVVHGGKGIAEWCSKSFRQ